MPCADAAISPTVLSSAAGRMRVHAAGLHRDDVRAVAVEQKLAGLSGVRMVQVFPRTASVVIWHSADCDTAIVLAAVADSAGLPTPPATESPSRSSAAHHHSGRSGGIVSGLVRALTSSKRDAEQVPAEIVRLRTVLDRLGYDVAQPGTESPSAVSRVERAAPGIHPRWLWLAVPVGLATIGVTTLVLSRVTRWLAGAAWSANAVSGGRVRRSSVSLAALTTSALAVPSWGGVVVTLVLVSVAGVIAHRQRLGLTREIAVAAGRAAVQLVAAGALLRLLFTRASSLGAAGWLIGMTIIAGQVAGRRAVGLPQARVAATGGVAASTAFTLGVLLIGRVVTAQARVIVPVGGMIVSSAMLAAGSSLRRLDDDVRQARPVIEARLSLGQDGRQAIAAYRQSALRGALIPAIDSTKVVGLISLPGAMTGLILAGISPLTAIRYQIVVMYMQLAGSALASLVAVRIAEESLFDDAHRLIQLEPANERPLRPPSDT